MLTRFLGTAFHSPLHRHQRLRAHRRRRFRANYRDCFRCHSRSVRQSRREELRSHRRTPRRPLVARCARRFHLPSSLSRAPIDTESFSAIDSESADNIEECVQTWNDLLRAQAASFTSESTNGAASLLLFSMHQLLTDVLDDPFSFELIEEDVDVDDAGAEGGPIWCDDLHLTAEVHDIIAQRLLSPLVHPA